MEGADLSACMHASQAGQRIVASLVQEQSDKLLCRILRAENLLCCVHCC